MSDIWQELKNEKSVTRHYYGDIVLFCFLLSAGVMLISLSFLYGRLPVPIYFSIFAILAIGIFAGFTNPLQKSTAVINFFISVVALFVFEYNAVKSYITFSISDLLFIVNQILALIFLFALYYSAKTLRAKYLDKKS